jgi:hypothetical protein
MLHVENIENVVTLKMWDEPGDEAIFRPIPSAHFNLLLGGASQNAKTLLTW